jgi:hypothetical protein
MSLDLDTWLSLSLLPKHFWRSRRPSNRQKYFVSLRHVLKHGANTSTVQVVGL